MEQSYIQGDWEKRAKDNQKKYKQWLQRAKVKDVIKNLPDLHEQAFEQIDCLSCGRCCRNHSPRFKTPDIKRISKTLRLKESVFIESYLRLDSDGDYVLQQSPCPFIAEDNTCGIYDDRPSDCARYPYTDEDVLVRRPVLTLKNSTVCPAVNFVMERLVK